MRYILYPLTFVIVKAITMKGSFYRRTLNSPAVSFSSPEGRQMFFNAQQQGNLEAYFALSEHFITQGHPSFCSLGSLTMALNALLIDPGRVWQGVWRWFDESMLDCCQPLEATKLYGMTIEKLGCLAHCNGAESKLKFGSNVSLEEFRRDIEAVCSFSNNSGTSDRRVMILSYHRPAVNQTGSGHFSPIGAFDSTSDMVLIMDVARFKYPPHWLPVEMLYAAMQPIDPDSGRSRGYLLLRPTDRMIEQCKQCGCSAAYSTAEEKGQTITAEDVSVTSAEVESRLQSLQSHHCQHCASSSGDTTVV